MNDSDVIDNNTINSTLQSQVRFQIISATVVMVTMLGMLCQIIAMATLIQCRWMRLHIKYPTVGFLLGNIIGLLSVAVLRVLIVWSRISDLTLESSQVFISGTFMAISISAVAHMSVDRLWACAAPFSHRRVMTDTTVKKIICIQWIIIPCLLLGSWGWDAFGPNRTAYEGCSLFCYQNAHVVLFANIIAFKTVTVTACCCLVCYIYLISRSDARAGKRTTINSVMTKVIVLDLVLGFPYVAHFVIEIMFPEYSNTLWNNIFHISSFVASTINSILTAFVFTLRLPECKKNLYLMFARCSSSCQNKALELQAELDKRHGYTSCRRTISISRKNYSQEGYVDNTSGYRKGQSGIAMVAASNIFCEKETTKNNVPDDIARAVVSAIDCQ